MENIEQDGRIREQHSRHGRPDTTLVRLADERGWRTLYFDHDGSGAVEVRPGIRLEVTNHDFEDAHSRNWSFALTVRATRAPISEHELTVEFAKILFGASQWILDPTEEEIEEARVLAAAEEERVAHPHPG